VTLWTYLALAVGVVVLLNVVFIVVVVLAADRTERHPEESASEF
jgi:hypothetical protein